MLYYFVDLDNTLFTSKNRMDNNDLSIPAYLSKDGSVGGYMNLHQRTMLNTMSNSGIVIPVTARNAEQFSLVLIQFKSVCVINMGATIIGLSEDKDRKYFEIITEKVKEHDYKVIHDLIVAVCSNLCADYSLKIVTHDKISLYFVVKSKTNKTSVHNKIKKYLSQNIIFNKFHIMVSEDELVITPHCVNKKNAVQYLMKEIMKINKTATFIGAGDSVTDIDFMQTCDYAITPTKSQIFNKLMSNKDV